jgi:hypothetical protein
MVGKKFWDPDPSNVAMVLNKIGERDKVLDVGGWWKPFTRANYVVDYLSYETRGKGGNIGHLPERFDSSTWFQIDICNERLPFGDKELDFIYCGQTLEDIRDPLWVCKEMIRVGKQGYIEVPSIWIECQYDVDAGDLATLYPGYEKHRWLVMIEGDKLTFIPKQIWLGLYNFVPREISEKYKTDQRIWTSYLLWTNKFQYSEMVFAGREEILPVLELYFALFDYGQYMVDS